MIKDTIFSDCYFYYNDFEHPSSVMPRMPQNFEQM